MNPLGLRDSEEDNAKERQASDDTSDNQTDLLRACGSNHPP
jgi:hypothetical protein